MSANGQTLAGIDVWIVDLDAMAAGSGSTSDLAASSSGAGRARQLVLQRRLAAHAALRQVLASCLGTTPDTVRLVAGQHGKPHLAPGLGPPLHFNLSHSRGLGAIAVAAAAPVGIDLEHLAPIGDGVTDAVLAPSERRVLAGLDADRAAEAFYRVWVRKEAILKAAGVGLSVPPGELEVPLAAAPCGRPLRLPLAFGEPSDWSLLDLDAGEGVAAAVAVAEGSARIGRITRLPGVGLPQAARWRSL
jgi:4'-phosphopantetheinyl transferase